MTYRRTTLWLLVSLALVAGSYLWANYEAFGSSDQENISIGLEDSKPTFGIKTTDELIEFWRSRFERDPRDYISLTYLARGYINKARERGDVSAYSRAEVALQKALQLNPNYELALVYMSTVRFAQHDFQAALEIANRVYMADPGALQALATVGDAHLELGNYAEAETAYQTLAEQLPSPPVYSRLARLTWLQGRPEQAIPLMQQAVDEAAELGLSGESLAWYYFQLGELYFNTGQLKAAEEQYRAALAQFDRYYLPLAGLGKVHAAQGQYDQAVAYYEQAAAIVPQPDIVAALGDVYTLAGQPEKAQLQYDTVEYIGKLAEINEQVYNRQLANFYADHDVNVDEALVLALAELEIRQDIYAFDTAAWAYYKNGLLNEAGQMIEQAMRLGTRDARLYYHAGMIAKDLGQTAKAKDLLAQALSINPYFDPVHAPTLALK